MTRTPPPPLPDDLDDEAAVRAWIAATSRPGSAPLAPSPADPRAAAEAARAMLIRDRHARVIGWFALGGLGLEVELGIHQAAVGGWDAHRQLPGYLLSAIASRGVSDALSDQLGAVTIVDALENGSLYACFDTVMRMAGIIRTHLDPLALDGLRTGLLHGDNDFGARTLRASAMLLLANDLGDEAMRDHASALAAAEVAAYRPALTEAMVYRAAVPVAYGDGSKRSRIRKHRNTLDRLDADMVHPDLADRRPVDTSAVPDDLSSLDQGGAA